MNWYDLITVKLSDKYMLIIEIGPAVFLFLLSLIGCFIYFYLFRKATSFWTAVEAEVQLGNIGKIKIRPSYDDVQIAHQAWVELVTRKAALPFQEDHDVISEVYNSWYTLFQEMRNLAKAIPAEKVRNSKDTQELVRLLIDALNLGLRPHLTQWQAKFRHWYDDALKNSSGKSPQEVQREYPYYRELVDDLIKVNKQIVQYANVIKQIAQGNSPKA